MLPLCLKPTLALCLAYCTVLLLCVAIAARALFEGVRPLILTEHDNGGMVLHWGRVPSVSAVFSKHSQNRKKNASAQGSLKFERVSNSFWEGTRREKRK